MATITTDDDQQMQGFGLLRGPGTGTSDSIPVAASDGEVIIPADKVRNFGAAQILAMVDKGGRGLPKPPVKDGRIHAAVGGLIEDDKRRAAGLPGSSPGSLLTPQPIMATTTDIAGGAMLAAGLGVMAPTTPAAPASAAVAPAAQPVAAPATVAGSSLSPQPIMATSTDIAGGAMPAAGLGFVAPVPAPTGPFTSAVATAPGRVAQLVAQIPTDGPRAPLPDGSQGFGLPRALQPAAQAVGGLVGQANAAPVPAVAPAAAGLPATQASVRQVDAAPSNAAAIAAAPAADIPASMSSSAPVPAGGLGAVTRVGNSYSGTNVSGDISVNGAPPEGGGVTALGLPARANPLGSMADTSAQLANLQASNASIVPGGVTAIDANFADRNARFNQDANQRNTLLAAQGLPSNSRARAAEVQAAQRSISDTENARAQTGLGLAREAGDTARATIQERGLDTRARVADARQAQANQVDQQRLGLDARRLALDANRDDRAATAAATEQAKATRLATLQDQVINGTPIQQRRAAEQLAALQGREYAANQPPAGYQRTADGNLEFIKGGPADPAVRGSRAPLNDTQSKALQFGTRMQVSGELLDALSSDAGGNVTQPGVVKRIADTFGAGAAANWTQSDKQQQVEQAQRDFINAVLRRESGAAISAGEFDNARKQYFPQPNDEPGNIELKRQNRLLATRGILAEVPDSEARVAQVRGVPAPAAAPAAPAAGSAASAPPAARVASDADFSALPSGTLFKAPDGTTRRKP